MQKRAFLLKYATLILITCLVARAYCVSASPGREYRDVPDSGTFLCFGQSIALADFDNDDRIDKATLFGVGRNKSLEIYLSHTKARALLHFDTQTSERGSLFTRDVDNDGDNDLIWTDLLHPDDVVIWLDDGTGRFESVRPEKYAAEFVLTDAPAYGDSEDPHQDFASGPQRNPFPSLSPEHKTNQFSWTTTFPGNQQPYPIVACCFQTPFDRGPPSLL
jgi:hypothetical protein